MKEFKDTLAFKIMSERWGGGKDMEQYFIDRNKEMLDKLKTEVKQ